MQLKVALLLPGYLDSPDYLHMLTFERGLQKLGYTVERLDPCHLWETGNVADYTISNFLQQIRARVEFYAQQQAEEIVLLGHSNGAFTSILAAARLPQVTKVIALCPPPDKQESARKWVGQRPRVSKRDLPDNPAEFREFAIPATHIEDALPYSAVEDVQKIDVPVMILITLDDVVVPPELTEKIVASARDPHVVRLAEMGHDFRHSQAQCDLVMAEIKAFLLQTTV